jgi:hypothetical protein
MYIAPSEIARAIHECPLSAERAYEEEDWLGFCIADDLRDLGWTDDEAPNHEAGWVVKLVAPDGQREVLITSDGQRQLITLEVFRRSHDKG